MVVALVVLISCALAAGVVFGHSVAVSRQVGAESMVVIVDYIANMLLLQEKAVVVVVVVVDNGFVDYERLLL